MSSLWNLVGDLMPNDHARQVTAYDLAREEMARPDAPPTVVDLGCGNARSARVFREAAPRVRWVGLDIEQSPYASAVAGEEIVIYDGVTFPFATATIPLFFSNQVFEHVRYPEAVLREVARTLVPGGIFIGSTSQLEPYHEYSLWNYTPYGFRVLVEAAGLEVLQVRPGIDGVALIRRQYEGRKPEHSRWFSEESPLNVEIDEFGAHTRRRPALVNNRKLQFCGQFSFRVRKPAGWVPPEDSSWNQVVRDARRLARRQVGARYWGARRAAVRLNRRVLRAR
jgi:SAM-dependent methyltransferase